MDREGHHARIEPKQRQQEEHVASAQSETMPSRDTTRSLPTRVTPTTSCIGRLPVELLSLAFDHLIEQAVLEQTTGTKTPFAWHVISPAHEFVHASRSQLWRGSAIISVLRERVAAFRGVCRSWRAIAQAYCDSVVSLDADRVVADPVAIRANLLSKPSPAHLELINQSEAVWKHVMPLLKSLLEERLGARLVGLSLRGSFRNQQTLRQLVDALPRGATQLESLDLVSWKSWTEAAPSASVDVAIEDELYATIANMRGLRQLRTQGGAVNGTKLLTAVASLSDLEHLSMSGDNADPLTGSPRLATMKLRTLELNGGHVNLHEAMLFARPHAPSLVSLRVFGKQRQPSRPAPSPQTYYPRLERLVVCSYRTSPHVPIPIHQPLLQEVLEQSPRLTHLHLSAWDVSLTGQSDPATSEASCASSPTLLQQIVQKAGSGVMKALRLSSGSAIDRAALLALKTDPPSEWLQSGVDAQIVVPANPVR